MVRHEKRLAQQSQEFQISFTYIGFPDKSTARTVFCQVVHTTHL